MTYRFPITIDLSLLAPSVKGLTDEVNNTMKEFGFNEKMVLRSTIQSVDVTINRPATEAELVLIRSELQKKMAETLDRYDPLVEKPVEFP